MRRRALPVVLVTLLVVVGSSGMAAGLQFGPAAGAAADADCTGRTSPPSELDIGTAEVGESTTESFTFKNVLDREVQVSGLSVGGEDADAFELVGGGGSVTVGPGECHTIEIEFTPDEAGDYDATLSVSASGRSESTALDGEGVEPAFPEAEMSPAEHDFGSVRVGSTSNTTFVVRNTGDAPLAIEDAAVGGDGAFSTDGTLPDVLAPGEKASLTVRYDPTETGGSEGTLEVRTNDSDDGTLTAALTGEGIETDMSVSPASLSFDAVSVGESATRTVDLTNEGTEPIEVTGLSIQGEDSGVFAIVEGGTTTIGSGETASMTVAFTPQQAVGYGGTLQVETASDQVPTAGVSLSGSGAAPDIKVAPGSVNFGKTVTSDVVTRDIRVINQGSEPLELTSLETVGANPGAFSVVGDSAPITVPAGETRALTVQFAPSEAGSFSASLLVGSNDPDEGTTSIYLSNTRTTVEQSTSQTQEGTTESDIQVDDAEENDTLTFAFSSGEDGAQTFRSGAAAASALSQDDSNVSLTVMNITVNRGGDFGLGVTSAERELGTTPAFELQSRNGTEPVGYLNVSHTIADDNIDQVEFKHRVSKQKLAELDADVEDYALYRHTGGEWVELDTTVVAETETAYVVEATSPGLSDFTSGVKQPKFRVVDADVDVTKINRGEDVGVRVTIRNDGGADGTYTTELILDGEVVATQDATIAAEGKRVVTFQQEISDPGTYTVQVNNVTVNDVEVTAAELNETPATATATEGGDGDDGPTETGAPGFGVVVALVALLAAAALARRD
jgi:PGF-CTERM protein